MKVKVAFASGTSELNRAMLDRFASVEPDLPLVVVSEFQTGRGEWIPYHVLRSFGANRAAVRAALGQRKIAAAAVVLADGTALAPMRALSLSLAPGSLIAYDENLNIVRTHRLPAWLAGRAAKQFRAGSAFHRWVHRVAHPAEAEIPVRARLAQSYGLAASRLRAKAREAPMGGAQPLSDGVTVVIPSRDGRELLETMLPALLPQIGAGEVIVVDNGSSDGTAQWLSRNYPAVQVIGAEMPLSFARAVNGGILNARFRHTLLLNNDMLVESGFVDALTQPFEQIPDLFCTTAQIFFPAGIRREETGKAVWRRENTLDFPVRCDDPIVGEDLTPVLYGSGGCSLFDTAKLREIGGVAEVYEPAYVEDMDFGYRAWKRGWPSVFCAKARVEHRHRATTARFFTSRELDYFVERNYLRFLIHAVGSPAVFRQLWTDAIRRLQLLAMRGNGAALDTLRNVPQVGPRPALVQSSISELEIFALGNGDVACFPGSRGGASKVVVIASPYLPFPLSHGGAVRIFNLMKEAAQQVDVVLIAFCDALDTPPPELLDLCREVVLVRRHGTHYRVSTGLPDTVREFESDTFRSCLKYTVRRWKPAIVQLEFTWLAQYAAACAPAKTVLVEHDITFDLQQQLLAANTHTGAARWELEQQLGRWRRFETHAWRQVDCVVTMSGKDAKAVRGARRVAVLPNGVDCDRFQPVAAPPEPKRLLFIGSFAHLPNLLALEYFLRDVWPRLEPGYILHVIAGSRPEYFLDFHKSRVSMDLNQPGIELEGFVSDVRSAYERAELVLAPLTASAGTNIKVLEAMASGRVVITTAAGMNGLDLAGDDIVLADDAIAMANEIQQLHRDRARRTAIELKARQTALRFDWREIGKEQAALYSL